MNPPSRTADRTGLPGLDVPGVELSRSPGSRAAFAAHRAGTNRWSASIGPAALAADQCSREVDPALPSQLLGALAGHVTGELVQLSIELDTCGAWVTLANAGECRPVLVRRAGWVDLRGHPTPPLGAGGSTYADDRVGLGPGDALVLLPAEQRRSLAANGRSGADGDDRLLDLLLGLGAASPLDAPSLAGALPLVPGGGPPIVVLRLPDELGEDRHGRLAAALGVPRHELQLPGYPLGDLQPDLWHEPPIPPRTARLHLPPGRAELQEVRALLARLLASWRIADRVAAADVALLASEVVSNALRHSGTDAAVTMRYTGPTVEISVRDGCTVPPVVLPPDAARLGGRGMQLVDALAAAWGTEPTADGKVVWFEVPVQRAG